MTNFNGGDPERTEVSLLLQQVTFVQPTQETHGNLPRPEVGLSNLLAPPACQRTGPTKGREVPMAIAEIPPTVGVVYFIRAGSTQAVKIGWTTDLTSRLDRLQCGNHSKLTVLATIPGPRSLEVHLHQRFRASRLRREWFRLTDDVRAYIVAAGGPRLLPLEHLRSLPEPSFDDVRAAMRLAEIERLNGGLNG